MLKFLILYWSWVPLRNIVFTPGNSNARTKFRGYIHIGLRVIKTWRGQKSRIVAGKAINRRVYMYERGFCLPYTLLLVAFLSYILLYTLYTQLQSHNLLTCTVGHHCISPHSIIHIK